MPASPDLIAVGSIHRLVFQVTPEMIERFVALTGDRSSLHTDEAFGRRCLYRRNVAHGMLPLLCIAALGPCAAGGAIRKIAARFSKPVFPYDHLELKARVTEFHPDQDLCDFEFSVVHRDSGILATTGSFTVAYGQVEAEPEPGGAETCMIAGRVDEECILLDRIAKGDEKEFPFQITHAHAQALRALLPEGLVLANNFDLANLLGASLLSTLVGMCLPGKFAVFLDFQLAFQERLCWNQRYVLKGKVSFKSDSAFTVVEDVSIREAGSNVGAARGKVSSQVYQPPVQMPPFTSLKATESDLVVKDKVVLITGASRGIGETTAKLFAVHGAKVALNYFRGKSDAEGIADEITSSGGSAFAVQADVTNRQEVRQMLQTVCGHFGCVDILVNNAVDNMYPVGFLNLTWEAVQRDLDVTVKGAFHCCQEVIPLMLKQGGGKIVNVSSVVAARPPANQAKFALSKSALEGLSRSLAVEFASQNIQVNTVVPSIVETDLTRHISKVFLDGLRNDTPMKRLATAVDVARAVLFLSSSLASFTTGQKVLVTGGSPPFL